MEINAEELRSDHSAVLDYRHPLPALKENTLAVSINRGESQFEATLLSFHVSCSRSVSTHTTNAIAC